MNIPLVNLKKQHEPLKQQLMDAICSVIDDSAFIGSAVIRDFEDAFAGFCGADYAIGVGSGTDALFLALKVAGIQKGDLVVTVPNTFIATTEAISMAGGKPVFVDVDPCTYNMDPHALEQRIRSMDNTERQSVKAVIPVHLYGQPVDMSAIAEVAGEFNLTVISDAAQAHGAEHNKKKLADWADLTCYSFYPGKNLGAFGDAGAIVTNNEEFAQRIRMLRNHGRTQKYQHEFEGFNCRMDSIQAAVLNVKLAHLKAWNENRIIMAGLYTELLSHKKGVACPVVSEGNRHIFHLYVIRHDDRDRLQNILKEQGISSGIHYPIPLHMQPAYKYLGYRKGDFPIAEDAATKILSLPLDGTITPQEVRHVADAVIQARGRTARR